MRREYPVYYVTIWVWDEGTEEYVWTTLVEPTKSFKYASEAYNRIEISDDIAEAIICMEDDGEATIIHKKDEWGEDWDL